jgi:hypothetical protein
MIGGIDPNDGTALTQAGTAIRDALASLQRLGQSDRADQLLADAERSTSYDDIANDASRSQDWKTTQAAKRYIAVMASLATKLTATANTAGSQDADDASRVYGVKGLTGDPASLAISRRDAGDRVADITDPQQLRDLLDSSVRQGDVVLSHAIAEAAIKSGDVDTTNAFSAAYADLAPGVERLWAAEHRKMTGLDITVAWRVAALKPPALASKLDYEIQQAAAGQARVN